MGVLLGLLLNVSPAAEEGGQHAPRFTKGKIKKRLTEVKIAESFILERESTKNVMFHWKICDCVNYTYHIQEQNLLWFNLPQGL